MYPKSFSVNSKVSLKFIIINQNTKSDAFKTKTNFLIFVKTFTVFQELLEYTSVLLHCKLTNAEVSNFLKKPLLSRIIRICKYAVETRAEVVNPLANYLTGLSR